MTSSWNIALCLALALIPSTLLGFLLGMFVYWPFVRKICSKVNGAPFRVGDWVLILSGRYKGLSAEVNEIITGQGGWEHVRLDLGQGQEKTYGDIFELYSVLKIRGETNGSGNGSEQGDGRII